MRSTAPIALAAWLQHVAGKDNPEIVWNPAFLPTLVTVNASEVPMVDISQVKEHMKVIGADGAPVGTVDRVEGDRIKLTKADSGMGHHKDHHHFIPQSLIADIEGDKVRLSANADVAVSMEQETDRPIR